MDAVTGGPGPTFDLLRAARRYFIKGRERHLVLERGAADTTEEALRRHFIHADGLMRAPVLVTGDIVVRGYHPDLYREALAAAGLLSPS